MTLGRALRVLMMMAIGVGCRGDRAPSAREAGAVVDEHLPRIEGLTPKLGERQGDKHALAILALEKAAVPPLVDRITDASPSPFFYLFQYQTGDVALALLYDLCRPRTWPFADGSHALDDSRGVLAYADFVATPEGRRAIQRSFRAYVERGGCRSIP